MNPDGSSFTFHFARSTPQVHHLVAVFLLALCALVAGACSTSPLSRYAELAQQKKALPPGALLVDMSMIDAVAGDTNKMDLYENMRVGKLCLNLLAGSLSRKGFMVDRSLLTSVGLLLDPDQYYRTARDSAEHAMPSNELQMVMPPFYIDTFFTNRPNMEELLRRSYLSLFNAEKPPGRKVMLQEAGVLGRSVGGGTLYVLVAAGYNVPPGTRLQNADLPRNQGADKIRRQELSKSSLSFYIVDAATGELLWDDRVVRSGGVVHQGKLFEMIGDLVDRLP